MSCRENGFALMDTLAALGHNWQSTSTRLRTWLFEQAAKRGGGHLPGSPAPSWVTLGKIGYFCASRPASVNGVVVPTPQDY